MLRTLASTHGSFVHVSNVSILVVVMLLVSCAPQRVATLAPTAGVPPSLHDKPTNTTVPTSTVSPTDSPIPPSLTPAPTRIACSLDSPYVGISNPGSAVYLLDLKEDCNSKVPLTPPGTKTIVRSWLPDGSGFVYVAGHISSNGRHSSDNVCIWDLSQQATTRCLVDGGDNYWAALWSPGNTNYVAYYRWDGDLEREFVTIARAESGEVVYETDRSLLESGTAERLLAWNPNGREVLISVSSEMEQSAVVLDVGSGSRRVLTTFEGEEKEYLVKGLWVQGGANVVLSLVDPIYHRNAEARPEARDLYWIRGDGTDLKPLLKDAQVAYYLDDPMHDRLLLDTYSLGSDLSPMYWLDLQRGTLTRVLDDEAESTHPRLLGLTPDGRYIITSDGQYRTWLFDVGTGKLAQLSMTVLGPIVWRPSQ